MCKHHLAALAPNMLCMLLVIIIVVVVVVVVIIIIIIIKHTPVKEQRWVYMYIHIQI